MDWEPLRARVECWTPSNHPSPSFVPDHHLGEKAIPPSSSFFFALISSQKISLFLLVLLQTNSHFSRGERVHSLNKQGLSALTTISRFSSHSGALIATCLCCSFHLQHSTFNDSF
ncbi:11750_t:CDS:1 [Acaulospora colombiana]|uniref:11750_t:CDS:1 n=1 Tax=Acaulospora colombiana TaxID=27376 RepID=A0ACA9MP59_9GLOM|nr:11750_t:CDS:1 [Acaulospora colombiana]